MAVSDSLGPLLDSLVVDAPVPPERLWATPPQAAAPLLAAAGADLDAAAIAALATLPGRVGVWLTGSAPSALLASWLVAARVPAVAVTAAPADALAVDDAGDAAAWYRLPRVHIELDASVAQTWHRLAEVAPVPVPDLRVPTAALLAQLAEVDVLLVDHGGEDWLAAAATRGLPVDEARQHYGCVPLRLGEWRQRMGLRRELLDPGLVDSHPTAVGCPPRAPLPPETLAPQDPAVAALRLELAGRLAGSVQPLLSAASNLAGVPIVAPFADLAFTEPWLAARRGPLRTFRRLLTERVPRDLLERPSRRPAALEARWLLDEPLPAWLSAELSPARLASRGWFDPVGAAHWLQEVRHAPDEPVNRLRGRMLLIAACLQRLDQRVRA